MCDSILQQAPLPGTNYHHRGKYSRKGLKYRELDSTRYWHLPKFAAHCNRLLLKGDHLDVIYWRKVSPNSTKYRQRSNDTHLTDKLLSRIIAVKISRHMAQYLSLEQKGISNYTSGANHQLLVDRAVIQHCKAKWANAYTAWIDIEDSPWQSASHMDSGEL